MESPDETSKRKAETESRGDDQDEVKPVKAIKILKKSSSKASPSSTLTSPTKCSTALKGLSFIVSSDTANAAKLREQAMAEKETYTENFSSGAVDAYKMFASGATNRARPYIRLDLLKERVSLHGGVVTAKVTKKSTHYLKTIDTDNAFQSRGLQQAMTNGIPVVDLDWIADKVPGIFKGIKLRAPVKPLPVQESTEELQTREERRAAAANPNPAPPVAPAPAAPVAPEQTKFKRKLNWNQKNAGRPTPLSKMDFLQKGLLG